uniref:Uncharacterized protein n=1 Tax=Meloidogyne enterolobii TaxID=390850 RepID=A0A6V7VCM3_MELEN|nr:unnamed protein product [Meloidogyne enterolobii]
MAEEDSLNFDWILLGKEKNDFKKLETNFDNLQIKFNEEKEKNLNLEKKNILLENELKEMDKVLIILIKYFL